MIPPTTDSENQPALCQGGGVLRFTAAPPASNHEPDSELIAAAQRGDRHAMHRLLAPWNDPIFGFLLAQLRHRADAEDAAQEVFIRVVKGLPGYEHRGEFRAWIFRIARHQATLTAMRRQRISESFDQWAIVEQARIRRMEKELATLKSDFQKAIANKEKVIETDTQKLIEESRAYQQTKP